MHGNCITLKLKVVAEKKSSTLQKGNLSDEKIQIKKIKKQPTEKKLYAINQHVVYQKHGVGKKHVITMKISNTNCVEIHGPMPKSSSDDPKTAIFIFLLFF